jgi:SAM-dependent methyltransferase
MSSERQTAGSRPTRQTDVGVTHLFTATASFTTMAAVGSARHRLFDQLAHRYDFHTPPHHYADDRAFVLQLARDFGARRLFDVGCGTGVLLAEARAAGLDVAGIDAAQGMVNVASCRLGAGVVQRRPMAEIDAVERFDIVASLSWSLSYARDVVELADVLRRCHRALTPGGVLVAQIAHAANAPGELFEDHEAGPSGIPDDISFFYRFRGENAPVLEADYVYVCRSTHELAFETHVLAVADAHACLGLAREVGFSAPTLFDSCRRESFDASVSPWLIARKGHA